MELKKNPNVDITKDRVVYRFIGFAFVFAITFIMFSFTFFDAKKSKIKTVILTDDAEQVVNTQHEVAPPPPPPPTTLSVVENTEEEVEEIQSTEFEEKVEITDPVVVADVVEKVEIVEDQKIYEGELEKKVDFKGGVDALSAFLEENLVYPEGPKSNEIEGVVMVIFTVEKNGKISDIRTEGKNDKELEAEAKRVILKTNGMWVPGEYKKKPVRSVCRIPITFEITEDY